MPIPAVTAHLIRGLPPLAHSLPLLMKRNGYATALVGKWHLGYKHEFSPRAHGFRPFFIDVAFNAPHSPTQRPDNPVRIPAPGGATRADYAAVMERVDRGVGEILQALRRRGLEKNTSVIFTNDNGGVGLSHSAPLFHRKFSAWEGGIRVPALFRWPGRLPDRGTVVIGLRWHECTHRRDEGKDPGLAPLPTPKS